MGDAYDDLENAMWRDIDTPEYSWWQRRCAGKGGFETQAERHKRIGDKFNREAQESRAIFEPKKQKPLKEKANVMAMYKFRVDGKDVYGKRLVVDGENWIMKAVTGEVHVIAKGLAEEVMPYTVGVRFINGPATTYHYFAKAGEMEVGDWLYIKGASDYQYVEVVGIDTKAKSANKGLDGIIVEARRITKVNGDDE
jgi:hypothetical protein